jgi:serine/threonine protein kinase/tetratricopeptide (TPR) repeat protein
LSLLAPDTQLGRYTIAGLLGVGGMGEVYRAHDTQLHRDVAIKVLPPDLADNEKALERFRREARAVAALSHPNILSIFDFGSEGGVHYAVTELLEGQTLRSRFGSGVLSTREALETLYLISIGVAAAHERGIVHRDLKPENIFITNSGLVKVLDFGLARGGTAPLPGHERAVTEMLPTEPGVVLGTIAYAAPEQLEALGVTPATDVFALGCVLYEMVTGTLPFERASTMSQMVAVLHDPAPRLEHTGEALRREVDLLVQRCLAKAPAERYSNAGELAKAIRSVLDGFRTTSRTVSMPRSRKAWIVIPLLLVIAAASFLWWRTHTGLVDHGYDLRVSDIRADAETRRLLELALRADAAGNRAKSMQLLEEAWRRPSRTSLPAAFLSSFSDAAGNADAARRWGSAALGRLDRDASTYESLLTRYLAAPSTDRDQELALSKSLLEIRPAAWRLRLAAAHILLGQREREAARRELQQIDVDKPDDRRLTLVLADRASLGDADGAERDLRRSHLAARPPFRSYVEGRIAWSRGDAKRAAALFDEAARAAANETLTTTELDSLLYAGVALLRLRRYDEAQQRFAATVSRARQAGSSVRVFDASACSAYTAWRAGDLVLRDRRFEEAASVQPPAAPMSALRLLAMRSGSTLWKRWDARPLEKDPELTPVVSLLRAREAFTAGDQESAKRELRRARAEGIDETEMREEAELLSAELGLPFTVMPADPPYPNMLRYLAIFDLPPRP